MTARNSVRKLIDEALNDAAPEDAGRLQRVIAAIPPVDDGRIFAALAVDTLRAVGRAEGGGSASRAATAVEAACAASALTRRTRAGLRAVSAEVVPLCA